MTLASQKLPCWQQPTETAHGVAGELLNWHTNPEIREDRIEASPGRAQKQAGPSDFLKAPPDEIAAY